MRYILERKMTARELIVDLRGRINPIYATAIGTESYERRICAEMIEAQADEIDRLRTLLLRVADEPNIDKARALADAEFSNNMTP